MTIRCIRIRRMRRSSRWLWWLPAESKFKTSVWFIWVTWDRIKVIVILNHIIHQKLGMVQIPDWFRWSRTRYQPIRPPPTGVWRSCVSSQVLPQLEASPVFLHRVFGRERFVYSMYLVSCKGGGHLVVFSKGISNFGASYRGHLRLRVYFADKSYVA